MARRITAVPPPLSHAPADIEYGWVTVQAAWRSDPRLSEQSAARFTEIGGRFIASLAVQDIRAWDDVDPSACATFIVAPTRSGSTPTAGTQQTRRAALRAIFRVLRAQGLAVGDPTLDEHVPARLAREYRPLHDDEIQLGRAACRLGGGARTLVRAVAWALAETGAATSEIPTLRVLDLDHPLTPTAIFLPGSRRFAARTVYLTDWAATVLARHLATGRPQPEQLIAYDPRTAGGAYRGQASAATNLTRTLDLAGLRQDPRVRARSIRGWAGRHAYDAGASLEDVAVLLGCRSLDTAAADIGIHRPVPRDGGSVQR